MGRSSRPDGNFVSYLEGSLLKLNEALYEDALCLQAFASVTSEDQISKSSGSPDTESDTSTKLDLSTMPADLIPTLRPTTVIVRNIPCKLSQGRLKNELMKDLGYSFNFLFLKIDRNCRRRNLGFAFVNFDTHELALDFIRTFQGYDWPSTKSTKSVTASFSTLQINGEVFVKHFLFSKVWAEAAFKSSLKSYADRAEKSMKRGFSTVSTGSYFDSSSYTDSIDTFDEEIM